MAVPDAPPEGRRRERLRLIGARARGAYVRAQRRRARDRTLARLIADSEPTVAAVGRALTAASAAPEAPEQAWIDRIEGLRAELGRSDEVIRSTRSTWSGEPADGARVRRSPVARLALEASKPERWGRVLLHLARELDARRALELGTCVGLSTAYQAAGLELAGGAGRLVTLEADPSRVELALANLERLGLAARVEARAGRFEETLDPALHGAGEVDFAFVDGHHQLGPTLDYFKRVTARLRRPGVILLDDITWSKGMQRAWARIAADQRVLLTVDLHGLGLCVVDRGATGASRPAARSASVFLHP